MRKAEERDEKKDSEDVGYVPVDRMESTDGLEIEGVKNIDSKETDVLESGLIAKLRLYYEIFRKVGYFLQSLIM